MELQWYDIRELTEDAALAVMGMMDETRRRRVADIAGEDDRKRTVAGELLARRMLAARLGCQLALAGAETFRVEDTVRRILRTYFL